MKKIRKQEFLEKMKDCKPCGSEVGHIAADEILCELLSELGFKEIVEEFEKLPKYYS